MAFGVCELAGGVAESGGGVVALSVPVALVSGGMVALGLALGVVSGGMVASGLALGVVAGEFGVASGVLVVMLSGVVGLWLGVSFWGFCGLLTSAEGVVLWLVGLCEFTVVELLCPAAAPVPLPVLVCA